MIKIAETEPTKLNFNFGNKVLSQNKTKEETAEPTKRSFNFGSQNLSQNKPKEETEEPTKRSFNFGNKILSQNKPKEETEEPTKPSFNFGNKTLTDSSTSQTDSSHHQTQPPQSPLQSTQDSELSHSNFTKSRLSKALSSPRSKMEITGDDSLYPYSASATSSQIEDDSHSGSSSQVVKAPSDFNFSSMKLKQSPRNNQTKNRKTFANFNFKNKKESQ